MTRHQFTLSQNPRKERISAPEKYEKPIPKTSERQRANPTKETLFAARQKQIPHLVTNDIKFAARQIKPDKQGPRQRPGINPPRIRRQANSGGLEFPPGNSRRGVSPS
ncbi:hypothetical protein NC315_34150, partial [Streptomyces sp. G2]|uniref:hypothetical protein n=1 Tax=Streptomyces sp. G2 TaxID=1684471 RepID=UPI00202E5EA1